VSHGCGKIEDRRVGQIPVEARVLVLWCGEQSAATIDTLWTVLPVADVLVTKQTAQGIGSMSKRGSGR